MPYNSPLSGLTSGLQAGFGMAEQRNQRLQQGQQFQQGQALQQQQLGLQQQKFQQDKMAQEFEMQQLQKQTQKAEQKAKHLAELNQTLQDPNASNADKIRKGLVFAQAYEDKALLNKYSDLALHETMRTNDQKLFADLSIIIEANATPKLPVSGIMSVNPTEELGRYNTQTGKWDVIREATAQPRMTDYQYRLQETAARFGTNSPEYNQLLLQGGSGNKTADIINYEYLQSLPPEQQKIWFQNKYGMALDKNTLSALRELRDIDESFMLDDEQKRQHKELIYQRYPALREGAQAPASAGGMEVINGQKVSRVPGSEISGSSIGPSNKPEGSVIKASDGNTYKTINGQWVRQ